MVIFEEILELVEAVLQIRFTVKLSTETCTEIQKLLRDLCVLALVIEVY